MKGRMKVTVRLKKRIATAVGLLLFLLTLGIVGGMEWGDIPIKTGAILSALCEAVGAFLLWKAGVIRV